MKQPLDVPKLTPTPIENDSIFNVFDTEEIPAVTKPERDLLDKILEILVAITAGMILGYATAWYLWG